MDADLWREILLNGSIVLLVGSFLIGIVTGEPGMARIEAFIVAPFQGVLCLFLLDMGLVAGRGMRNCTGVLTAGALAFGLVMPVVGAGFGLGGGVAAGPVHRGCRADDGAGGIGQLYRRPRRDAGGACRTRTRRST